MSLRNDMCDFCGSYVDPIGGDLAIAVWYAFGGLISIDRDTLWCGSCEAGEKAYGRYQWRIKQLLWYNKIKRKVKEWLLKRSSASHATHHGKEN